MNGYDPEQMTWKEYLDMHDAGGDEPGPDPEPSTNPYHARIQAEEDHINALGDMTRGVKADAEGQDAVVKPQGDCLKHYTYSQFDEVYLERYANGVLFHEVPSGKYLWWDKAHQQAGFEHAKLRGQRARGLNRMLG